jgi:hypothetical protein
LVDEGGGQHLPEVNVSATQAELVEAVPHLFYACAAKCWTAIEKKPLKNYYLFNIINQGSVVDPDLCGSALILVGLIRIRMGNPYPDPDSGG